MHEDADEHKRGRTLTLKSIPDSVAPRVAMWMRAQKNRRELFGLHAPPALLSGFVPQGSVAVDAGAAHGLYTYFLAKRASTVHAFEPNPAAYDRLTRGAGPRICPYNVALSDHDGFSTLHVPLSSGEASLVAHRERATTYRDLEVTVKRLDSYGLKGVGLIKIDVEGHEDAVLRGALETIDDCRPAVFIEVEERHRAGAVSQVAEWFRSRRYRTAMFLHEGELRPMAEFDLGRHQLEHALTPSASSYSCNFLFLP